MGINVPPKRPKRSFWGKLFQGLTGVVTGGASVVAGALTGGASGALGIAGGLSKAAGGVLGAAGKGRAGGLAEGVAGITDPFANWKGKDVSLPTKSVPQIDVTPTSVPPTKGFSLGGVQTNVGAPKPLQIGQFGGPKKPSVLDIVNESPGVQHQRLMDGVDALNELPEPDRNQLLPQYQQALDISRRNLGRLRRF